MQLMVNILSRHGRRGPMQKNSFSTTLTRRHLPRTLSLITILCSTLQAGGVDLTMYRMSGIEVDGDPSAGHCSEQDAGEFPQPARQVARQQSPPSILVPWVLWMLIATTSGVSGPALGHSGLETRTCAYTHLLHAHVSAHGACTITSTLLMRVTHTHGSSVCKKVFAYVTSHLLPSHVSPIFADSVRRLSLSTFPSTRSCRTYLS